MNKLFTAILLLLSIYISYPQGLDNTFGIEGKATTNITPCYDEYPQKVLIQEDGKIILTGYAYNGTNSNANFNIVRYNADGSLDNTFGARGKVSTDFDNSQDIVLAAALQQDGKIIVAGYTSGNDGTFYNDIAVARYNTDGTLDESFGGTGKVRTNFGSTSNYAYSIAVQENGKIVVGGFGYDGLISGMAFVRYNSDGSLDATFDSDGKVIFDNVNLAISMDIQSDGKILAVTSFSNGSNNDFVVVRLNSDGSLDGTFGTGGISAAADFGNADNPQSIAIQTDRKILVAGYATEGTDQDFALARYNLDGSVDLSFGSNGKVKTDFNNSDNSASSVLIQSDDKIILTGQTGDFGSRDFALARYNSDGILDDSFGTDGLKTLDFTGDVSVSSAALQADEKIIIGGSISSPTSSSDFAVVRLDDTGSLDNSFSSDGVVTTDLGNSTDVAYSTALQTDGKIIIAGGTYSNDHYNLGMVRYNADGIIDTTFSSGSGKVITDVGATLLGRAVAVVDDKIFVAGNYDNGANNDFFLSKYNSDGSLDNTFPGAGSVITDLSGSNDYARSLAVQANKKMVAAGYTSGSTNDFALVRYNVDGSLDMSFSSDGILTADFAGGNDIASSVVIQADQKIIAAGYSQNGSSYDFSIVRYNTDGTLDNDFGTNGKITTDIQSSNDLIQSILIQPDNKIVAVGYSYIDTLYAISMVRYEPDGQIDNSFGENGKVFTTVNGYYLIANSAAIQTDGKIIVSGFISDESSDFLLIRYNTDGTLDQTFGNNGMEKIDFNNSYDVAFSSIIQPDGKLIAAGYSFDNFSNDFALLRYNTLYPSIQISNKTIDFGEVKIDSSVEKNVYVKNTGSASLNIDSIASTNPAFDITPQSFIVAPGDSQEVEITFSPTAASNYNGLISFYNNTLTNPDTINVSGKGIAENSQISLSISAIDFGIITVNDSISKHFFVRNNGSADLQIIDIVSNKSNFRVNIKSFTVAPGDSQQVVVTFQPTDTIQYDGILSITHNSQGSPSEISLSGKGTSELVAIINLSASNLNFGSITVNSNLQKSILINNIGTDTLHVTNISSNQNVFTVNSTNFNIAPKGSQEVTITFTPTDSINYNAVLTITHDAGGNPSTINLTGRGISGTIAIISLSVNSLDFGTIMINNNVQKNISIKNIGTASLLVDSIVSNNSAFAAGQPSNFAIAPNDSHQVEIIFTPSSAQTFSAVLDIFHNAAGSPSKVNLAGTGFSYPSSLAVNVTKTFGNISDISNYRIVGVPGQIDLLISSLESGDYEYDWSVYDDNGQEENYLVAGNNFKFTPGKAFWIISKNPITINQQINSVAINAADYSFSIPLHSGWNLITSPFNKSVDWNDIKTLNSLPQNSVLYTWTGSWSNPLQLSPFEGYYFNNTVNLTELKIPFASGPTAGKISKANNTSIDFSKFLKLSLREKNHQEVSDIFVGINSLSKEEFDECDYYAAPGDFQKTGIRLIMNDLPERQNYFFIEQRPQIEKGQSFNLEIKSIPNMPVSITWDGINNFDNYNVYLLDLRLKNLYNLKELNNIELNLAHQFNSFRLVIGTDEYLNEIKSKFLPSEFSLFQNYPNPFNPETIIRFSLKEKENINLKIYNILGEAVRTLISNKAYNAGNYEIQFFAGDLASGVYIARLESDKFTSQIKMVLLK